MSDNSISAQGQDNVLTMVADIVTAYVGNNTISTTDLPHVINTVFSALVALSAPSQEKPIVEQKPAVPLKKSYTDEYIICLEDGKRLKMLKRYLRSHYNMSPDEYRMKWGLPADYPMVAPSYAAQRSAFAKRIGLGKSGGRRGQG